MSVWFDLFQVQANIQSDLLAADHEIFCAQITVVILLITFKVTI